MSKDERPLLSDMRDHAQKIMRLSTTLSWETFQTDEVSRSAIYYWLQIIGEAANRIDPNIRGAVPTIPWRDIIGMRNRLVHAYLGIDDRIIWNVITQDIPNLLLELDKLLTNDPSS